MNWLVFIIASLATYRIADIIADEEGPAAIFAKLRKSVPPGNPKRGISCPYCVGVWVAGLLTAWLWHLGQVPLPMVPVYLFGVSGCSAAIKSAIG